MSGDSTLGDGNSPATSVAPALEELPGVPVIPRSSQEALYTTAITPEAVARQLEISRAQVYKLMATRELRSFRIGRSRRVWLVDLVDYIRRRRLAEEADQ
jgi:excisionase family DNA binding protein